MDFSGVKSIIIPEGSVKKIVANGVTLWEKISYTNQIPLSIGSDKKPYNNGQGWKANTRLNSSGNETSATGVNVTGFIPVKKGDTVYMKNIKFKLTTGGTYYDYSYLMFYNSNFAQKFGGKGAQLASASYVFNKFTTDANGYVTSFYLEDRYTDFTPGYMRISAEGVNANAIITINEPID